MYSETDAAKVLGINPRSLRTERTNGRIGYKMVAGKVMYRHSQLVAWQQEGSSPCQDEALDHTLFASKRKAGPKASTTSAGQKMAGQGSVRQAKQTSNALKKRSQTGLSNNDTRQETSGQVVPLKQG
jgi:hypothetical protein